MLGALTGVLIGERDAGTETEVYGVREAPLSADMVAGHESAALRRMRAQRQGVLLQHSAGEHRDSKDAEAVDAPIATPPPEPPPATPLPRVEPEITEAPVVSGGLTVSLTFYVCQNAPPGQSYCGAMASGIRVYEGAAACGYGMALGTRFTIAGDYTGRVYVCEDRGAGPHWWIDVFWYDYYEGRAWRDTLAGSVEIWVQ